MFNVLDLPSVTTFSTDRNTPLSSVLSPQDTIIEMAQPHDNQLAIISERPSASITLPDVDAVATSLSDITLIVRTADCLPILIYHPLPVIVAIHAGRKGTENNITLHTLSTLTKHIPDPTPYKIWFGPAICAPCYEIDPIKKIHFDLIQENKKQVHAALPTKNFTIYESKWCTACHNEQFYSYRKNNKTPLRLYSGIALTTS